ncbi:hypothetical protein HUN33_21770 [Acinetobacter bereziniae]|uniref:hypothetical protein n=1 Tax=Acinetobacter bereziniae TaxID=106648 RepID=UPI001580337A|nr:hypothetical protein [Acinetobacter bereziniae]NUF62736.1 hypothetical protein [Acinetobacter bereziniae]NUG09398.1 hypothetical protein [Acinetobacter bereziniae]NUG65750.1 hypothetical protein [Acinetobacter bereziniae]NUG68983.1 hypothetical protein [Acinetobacter bereziniae]NUG82593.1 hypothetical protein [Acinetobacter bereziniae]
MVDFIRGYKVQYCVEQFSWIWQVSYGHYDIAKVVQQFKQEVYSTALNSIAHLYIYLILQK